MKVSGKSIAAVVALVVVGAAAVAIGSGGGGGPAGISDADLKQYQPVKVSGTPLPAMPEDDSADVAIGEKVPVVSGFDFAGKEVSLEIGRAHV